MKTGTILIIVSLFFIALSIYTFEIPTCGRHYLNEPICFNQYGGTTFTISTFFFGFTIIGFLMNKGENGS